MDYKAKFERELKSQGDLYSLDDILRLVNIGEMQMFSDGNSVVVTRICEFPRARVLEIVAMAGDYDAIRSIENDKVLPFAREIGASKMMAAGRTGFMKRRPEGWELVSANFIRGV